MAITDQIGRQCAIPHGDLRIVSLVPSQTELLYDLGLDNEVIGITNFCVHPENWRKEKSRVGGTKDPRIDQILELQPNLILANKEENRKEDIVALAKHCPVYTSDIVSLDEALTMIRDISILSSREKLGEELIKKVSSGFDQLPSFNFKFAYLIWYKPIMSAGQPTFISHLFERLGGINVLSDPSSRYPEYSLAEIKDKGIDVLFLSSEPYPFNEKHRSLIQKELPNTKVLLVDGELCSWYGSRLVQSIDYFRELIKRIKPE